MTIENLPPLRDIIKTHQLSARKSLGQNFLLDLNLTRKIARAAGDLTDSTILEVGPGPGGLTRSLLLEGAQKVIALEQDGRAVEALHSLQQASKKRLQVIQGDALSYDYSSLNAPLKIVANLPYNISTVLLIKWIETIDLFSSLTLMFQKEVAHRLNAPIGHSNYGRLSVMVQWRAHVQICFDIPPSAFVPAPKVTSTVVHITPRTPDPQDPKISFKDMETVTRAAFGQRRKMIRSSLKSLWGEETLDKIHQAELCPEKRAQDLSLHEFLKLAALL